MLLSALKGLRVKTQVKDRSCTEQHECLFDVDRNREIHAC